MTVRTYDQLVALARQGKMYPQAVLDAIESVEKIFADLIVDCKDIPLEDSSFVKELVTACALRSLDASTFQVETRRTYRSCMRVYVLQERCIGRQDKVFTIRAVHADGKLHIYVKKGKTSPRLKQKSKLKKK